MTRHSRSWASSLFYALFVSSTALAQATPAATSSNPADGLVSTTGTVSAPATVGTALINGTQTTYSVQFTVPAVADEGQHILPNIQDPEAVDAQTVCPGYTASNVKRSASGFSATLRLAGEAVGVSAFPFVSYI